jgi:hypothetical protein
MGKPSYVTKGRTQDTGYGADATILITKGTVGQPQHIVWQPMAVRLDAPGLPLALTSLSRQTSLELMAGVERTSMELLVIPLAPLEAAVANMGM